MYLYCFPYGDVYAGREEWNINATVQQGFTWEKWTSYDTTLLADSALQAYSFAMPAGAATLTASATLDTRSVTYNGLHGSITGTTSADYNTAYSGKLLPENGYGLPASITMTMLRRGQHLHDFLAALVYIC